MKRFLGISFAAFIALIAFALVSGDTAAVAGLRHGCHGRRCHGRRCHGLLHRRKNRCHGEEAVSCNSCGEACSGCASGNCGGEAVIEEAAPTEAAPTEAAPTKAAPEAPAAPAKT
ncbi:MAG: hypothetical protein ACO37F_03045 [Pirellulales bacterium]